MNRLSLHESGNIAKEADFLCDLIKSYAPKLREAHWGRKVSIEGVFFQLFQNDRNTIYRIESNVFGTGKRGLLKGGKRQLDASVAGRGILRTRSKRRVFRWYLKMPREKWPKMVSREILGAEIVRKTLGSHRGYFHMDAIRASEADAYILYSEIPGRPLHLAFYRECLVPVPNGIKRYLIPSTLLTKTFRHFGDAIARFHVYQNPNKESLPWLASQARGLERKYPSYIPPTNRHPAASLRKIIDKITASDAISRTIFRWVEKQQEHTVDHSIVHGNLRLDNVIVYDGKICLIDFENCGHGPLYTDLSWICCLILLTRALPLFPWRRAQLALRSFLDGYKSVSDYDREILLQFVTMRLCDFYIGTYYSGHVRAKIAGIPVSKSRFQHLLMVMLEGKVDPMLEKVNL